MFPVWGMFSTGSSIRVLGPQLLVLFGEMMQPWWRKDIAGGGLWAEPWPTSSSLPLFQCVDEGVTLELPATEACCHASLPLGLYFLELSSHNLPLGPQLQTGTQTQARLRSAGVGKLFPLGVSSQVLLCWPWWSQTAHSALVHIRAVTEFFKCTLLFRIFSFSVVNEILNFPKVLLLSKFLGQSTLVNINLKNTLLDPVFQ